MSPEKVKNNAASVRARLLQYAKQNDEGYQRVLARFAIERLLFRLGYTDAAEHYVLKGAMLFVTWPEQVFRPTGDLDLLGSGSANTDTLAQLFARICQVEVPDDGIVFQPETIEVEAVRGADKYAGVRVKLKAELARAIIPVQIDVGFGDHVYPPAVRQEFPSLLPDLPSANILMYPPETVVAEKFEAIVRFGEANTRLKDYYDIWITACAFDFDLSRLTEAVSGTLRRRETAQPIEMPIGLSLQFARNAVELWDGFLNRNPPALTPPPLEKLLEDLQQFFGPVISSLGMPEAAYGHWNRTRRAWY